MVILTWNSARYAEANIGSLIEDLSQSSLDYSINIVDNGSADGTRDILEGMRRRYGENRINLIYLDRNYGTTMTRNMVLSRADSTYIAIVDSDTYCQKGCFTRLIEVMQSDPAIAIAAPRLVYPDGRYQKSTDEFPTVSRKIMRFLFLKQIESIEQVTGQGPVDYAISAFWLMKRSVIDHVGLFDERIFYSPEDVDYCLRVWKAGYMVHYVPDAMVVHDAQERSRVIRNYKLFLMHLMGLLYYFLKHRYFIKKPVFLKH